MGFYYEFYKIYKMKPEEASEWYGKVSEELPEHLQFFSKESVYALEQSEVDEIQVFLQPVTMLEDGRSCRGYLGKMFPVACFGKEAYETEYRAPRSGWYHFVKLTNSRAKRMIRQAYHSAGGCNSTKCEYMSGRVKKDSGSRGYPGKLRHIVYIMHQ